MLTSIKKRSWAIAKRSRASVLDYVRVPSLNPGKEWRTKYNSHLYGCNQRLHVGNNHLHTWLKPIFVKFKILVYRSSCRTWKKFDASTWHCSLQDHSALLTQSFTLFYMIPKNTFVKKELKRNNSFLEHNLGNLKSLRGQ